VAARVRELIGADDPGDPDDPADRPGPGPDREPLPGGSWRERLGAVVPVRIDPGRRATLAMAAAVVVAAVITAAWVMSSRPRPVALSAVTTRTTSSSAAGPVELPGTVPLSPGSSPAVVAPATTTIPTAGVDVVVDVAGRVRRPGLYHLPAGSRIDDALTAAGGARRGVDLTALNLAALLADGQQIVVGPHAQVVGAPPDSVAAADGAAAASTAPVSLNTATLEELETLPRVGPVTAQKILDYRAAHGDFTAIDQLKDVSGIGDVTFAGLAPLVTL
jgi:competence protein ComEA